MDLLLGIITTLLTWLSSLSTTQFTILMTILTVLTFFFKRTMLGTLFTIIKISIFIFILIKYEIVFLDSSGFYINSIENITIIFNNILIPEIESLIERFVLIIEKN